MAAQAGFCLAWSETPEDTFCRVVAQIVKETKISVRFSDSHVLVVMEISNLQVVLKFIYN